ncbi:FtsX-like permease family protein [Aeromicrobium sp. P5_D10]
MSQFSASWRVALRAGRRDVLRSKGRSALVMTMVGTPVLLTVMLTSIVASSEVSPAEGLRDDLGFAEASAAYFGGTVEQLPDGRDTTLSDDSPQDQLKTPDEQADALAKLVDGRVDVVERGWGTTVVIDGKGFNSESLGVDGSSPAAKGLFRLASGRVPRAEDEVVVSQRLADKGAVIGSTVQAGRNDALKVVGIGRIGTVTRGGDPQSVIALPGVLPSSDGASFLIDRPAPVTWDDVKQLNAAGFGVTSKYVLAHPPAAADLYPGAEEVFSSGDDSSSAVLAVVVTAIVLEVVLLAGPAFAVGVRRQRRDLALLAATGASPKQIRRVVLGQALVLGVLACLIAAALGTALSALVVWLGPSVVPKVEFGPFEMQWSYVVAAIILGSLAAMGAAFVPARQASTQEVAAVLAGRRGTVRSSRGWPIVGIALVLVGLATCFTLGTRQGGELAVAASTIAIVFGAVFLTPLVIGAVARAGGWLPLSLRLALRDTARQRARSAPAIAAVMASVAGITTLAIGSSSDFEQSRRDYQYQQQPGRMTVNAQPDVLESAMAAATQASGGVRFTSLGSAGRESSLPGEETWVYARTEEMYSGTTEVVVANAAAARDWGVRLDADSEAALDSGVAVVGDRKSIKGGKVVLEIESGEKSRRVDVPAVLGDLGTGEVPSGPEPELGLVLISPQAMKSIGVPWESRRAISVVGAPSQSKAVEARVEQAVSGLDPQGGGAYVERGFQESFALPFLALLGFGVVAVLVGTMTATGLALSDARPDFSTLAAVGAAPRTRRLVAGAQAIVLATLGTLLGIAVGFAPGIAVTWPLTSESYASGVTEQVAPIIQVPWLLLGAIVVVVPLIAALAAMMFTRSRLPIVRRLAQ